MKTEKIFAFALALVIAFSLCACGSSSAASYPGDSMSLSEIKDDILSGVEDLPTLMDIEPDEESFSYFTFVQPEDGLSALVSEAAMSAVAHSLVLLRTSDEQRAQELAKEIEANADPRKWICVEAEKTIVSTHGSTILLIMSAEKTADAIAANFDSLWT